MSGGDRQPTGALRLLTLYGERVPGGRVCDFRDGVSESGGMRGANGESDSVSLARLEVLHPTETALVRARAHRHRIGIAERKKKKKKGWRKREERRGGRPFPSSRHSRCQRHRGRRVAWECRSRMVHLKTGVGFAIHDSRYMCLSKFKCQVANCHLESLSVRKVISARGQKRREGQVWK